MKLRSLVIFCVGLLLAAPSWAQGPTGQETCPHEKGWKPTNEELQQVISDHKAWLGKDARERENDLKGKANLCNADLSGAELNHANLSRAKLNNANLSKAELNNADLSSAGLNHANLAGEKLNNANLSWAELNNADLSKAELNHAKLIGTKLNNANLSEAELTGADLLGVVLNNANLYVAKLNNANLGIAELNNANLALAELNNADLLGAELNNANLNSTKLKDATIADSTLTNAIYAPASAPPDSHVSSIKGLSTVTFPSGGETGLVQLRDLLQKAGLRDLEREATFAIESGKTKHLLQGWEEHPPSTAERAEGAFRYTAFDLTTAYGLRPARALLLILALWALLIPIYAWPIWQPRRPITASSICRIWPNQRVEVRDDRLTLDNPARVERLHERGLGAVGWAAYFSLLSTFQIGFREFSVGTWLSRAQPRNFVLEATGWVRTVSGMQSLLSVYLLAMWLLTYFGRPFQ